MYCIVFPDTMVKFQKKSVLKKNKTQQEPKRCVKADQTFYCMLTPNTKRWSVLTKGGCGCLTRAARKLQHISLEKCPVDFIDTFMKVICFA